MAGQDKSDGAAKGLRNAFKAWYKDGGIEVRPRHWPPEGKTCQVAAFFLRWTCERLLTSSEKKTTRPRRGKARSHGGWNGALIWLFLDKYRTLFYGSGNLWFTVCLWLIESSNKQAVVRFQARRTSPNGLFSASISHQAYGVKVWPQKRGNFGLRFQL